MLKNHLVRAATTGQQGHNETDPLSDKLSQTKLCQNSCCFQGPDSCECMKPEQQGPLQNRPRIPTVVQPSLTRRETALLSQVCGVFGLIKAHCAHCRTTSTEVCRGSETKKRIRRENRVTHDVARTHTHTRTHARLNPFTLTRQTQNVRRQDLLHRYLQQSGTSQPEQHFCKW